MEFEPLLKQYRGGYHECTYFGNICIVDENGVRAAVGDPEWYCFYRSASKPIQSLPAIMEGIPGKYGLTEAETAIFSGSHWGEPYHVHLLESICAKTGLSEDMMIMKPTYPLNQTEKYRMIREGLPPRKLYHNCAGKHLCLMLLSKELGEDIRDYWKAESKAQMRILDVISKLTDTEISDIHIGVDGCGVPVYGVPAQAIAKSFLRLACPDLIEDRNVALAVKHNRKVIQDNPRVLDGEKGPCACMSRSGDIIAKAGAFGVHAFGINSSRIGGLVKISDGNDSKSAFCTMSVLEQLGYNDKDLLSSLHTILPSEIYNDNQFLVGEQECLDLGLPKVF